ncbi:MAG: hypothetical protein ACKVRO_14010 [Micropepsaceae bacterium]
MSVEAQGRPPEVFSASVAIIMFVVGVFAFSAFLTLSTFAPDFVDGDDGKAHALSKSAIGYAGLVKLARAQGTSVTVSRAEPKGQSADLVVLTPEDKVTLAEIEKLAHSSALIVLPKWLPRPSNNRRGWVRESTTMGDTADIVEDFAPKAQISEIEGASEPRLLFDPNAAPFGGKAGAFSPGKIEMLQTIAAPEIIPMITTAAGKTVLGYLKNSEEPAIYVLADPDLLNNHGIADLKTARAGLAILDTLRSPEASIAFDVSLNGFERSRSLLRLALEPPLLAATLSFVIVAGMIAWRAATRSGPTARGKRAIALGKRTLADNSAALIRLAGRDATMAPRYARMVRTVVAEEIKVSRDANETTTVELDRIAQSRGVRATYSELAAEAAAANTAAETLTAARRLHAWTGDMIRATR